MLGRLLVIPAIANVVLTLDGVRCAIRVVPVFTLNKTLSARLLPAQRAGNQPSQVQVSDSVWN